MKTLGLGLSGQARILDIGGTSNLTPVPNLEKIYELKDFPKLAEFEYLTEETAALMIGAGAANWTFLDRNAEV